MNVPSIRGLMIASFAVASGTLAACNSGNGSAPSPVFTSSPTTTPTMTPTMTPSPNATPTMATQTAQSCPGLLFNNATNLYEGTLVYSAANQVCGGGGAYFFKDGNGTLEPATVMHTTYDATRIEIQPSLNGTTRTNSDPGTYFSYRSLKTGNSTIALVFQVSNANGTMSTYNGLFTVQASY